MGHQSDSAQFWKSDGRSEWLNVELGQNLSNG